MPSISSCKISPCVLDKIICPLSPYPREVDIIPVSSLDFTDGETEARGTSQLLYSIHPQRNPRDQKVSRLSRGRVLLLSLLVCYATLPRSVWARDKDWGTSPSQWGTPGQRVGSPYTRTDPRAHSHTQSSMHPLQVLSGAPVGPCSAWGCTAPSS